MMKLRILGAATAIAITACVSSGVIPIGDGEYMIAKHSATTFANGGSQKAEVYREANAYCVMQGKELTTTEVTAENGVAAYRAASAELHFRCVAKPS
jgi:hypothetical protein